jgi:hypothetical protein
MIAIYSDLTLIFNPTDKLSKYLKNVFILIKCTIPTYKNKLPSNKVLLLRGRDSSVGIVTDYRLNGLGI